ncbi:ribose-phosphate pyrophosphokinase [Candidatus Oleimmundimicrobium sp.]|uniref:ribose-phosphate diphosphokinase n=1 Tax=Candidatus Oleimmundimicrobium sp. TaxID=3060597 RepID=UPI0027194E3C|nr:ribose-phosphate pyrophosphokinase [Candidatus Oleimmundimicrobium sp.]MDO8886300.1 ribose-phosphate pyrophosphokinase [Candidatus Oleimmundimicrobium sp.]
MSIKNSKGKLMIFTGRANPELGKEIANYVGVELGKADISTFKNGEIYAKYRESVRGSDAFLIQSFSEPVNDNLMELLIMVDAMKRASAARISAVIPYYAYARQDKKTEPREPISAKLIANLLTTAGVDRVLTMDLHAGQIQGFFDVPVDHLTALPILANYFKKRGLDDLIVVSPDVGRVKIAKRCADRIGVSIAVLHKSRPAHNVAEITQLVGDVKGKRALIIDDMIDTGGTIVYGAETLLKNGAKEVYVCATHGIFSGQAAERLDKSPIKEVVVTNTIPVPPEKRFKKLKVLSIGPLFSQVILNVHEDESVSEIFQGDNIV